MVLDGNKEASLPNWFRYTLPVAPIANERKTGMSLVSEERERESTLLPRFCCGLCSVPPVYLQACSLALILF